jgi:hypothetical protein
LPAAPSQPSSPPAAPAAPDGPERPPPVAPAPLARPPAASPPALAVSLVGNSRSKKYHLATCDAARKIGAGNRVELKDRDEAKRLGYEPCGRCLGGR